MEVDLSAWGRHPYPRLCVRPLYHGFMGSDVTIQHVSDSDVSEERAQYGGPNGDFATSYIISAKYPTGKKVFRCPQCHYVTDRKNNLKRHIGTMHQDCGKALECCDVIFHSKAALREHVIAFHRSGYRCRYCSRNFCRKALLKRHLMTHIGDKGDFVCSICDYSSQHKPNLEKHKLSHYPNPYSQNETETETSDIAAIDEEEVNQPRYVCDRKQPRDTHPPSVRLHRFALPNRLKLTHHTTEDSESQEGVTNKRSPKKSVITMATATNRLYVHPYKCSECREVFTSQRDLACHLKDCRNPDPEPQRPLKYLQSSNRKSNTDTAPKTLDSSHKTDADTHSSLLWQPYHSTVKRASQEVISTLPSRKTSDVISKNRPDVNGEADDVSQTLPIKKRYGMSIQI